jgi:hypothetical protein
MTDETNWQERAERAEAEVERITKVGGYIAMERDAARADAERLRGLVERLLAAAEDGWGHNPKGKAKGECVGCDAVLEARAALASTPAPVLPVDDGAEARFERLLAAKRAGTPSEPSDRDMRVAEAAIDWFEGTGSFAQMSESEQDKIAAVVKGVRWWAAHFTGACAPTGARDATPTSCATQSASTSATPSAPASRSWRRR